MDSAYEIGYVMTYLLLDINHEIIFYSNQTDRVSKIDLNLQEQKIQQARALLKGFDQVVISRNLWPGITILLSGKIFIFIVVITTNVFQLCNNSNSQYFSQLTLVNYPKLILLVKCEIIHH